jgi:hypothetical protein
MSYVTTDLLDAVLSRRRFLALGGVLAGASLATGFGLPRVACAGPTQTDLGFLQTSSFLTGHTLDATTARRFLAALTKLDAGFVGRLGALQAAIAQSGAATMDAFLAQDGHSAAILSTAKEIVSAWYLGVVGTGSKAVLISFYDALMFEPTRNYVYVPSYGGGPDSWVPTPPFRLPVEKRHA